MIAIYNIRLSTLYKENIETKKNAVTTANAHTCYGSSLSRSLVFICAHGPHTP